MNESNPAPAPPERKKWSLKAKVGGVLAALGLATTAAVVGPRLMDSSEKQDDNKDKTDQPGDAQPEETTVSTIPQGSEGPVVDPTGEHGGVTQENPNYDPNGPTSLPEDPNKAG